MWDCDAGPIDLEQYEQQPKRGNAGRLNENNQLFQEYRQEGTRMIPESDARLEDGGAQGEDERACYEQKVGIREMENIGRYRGVKAAEKMRTNRRLRHDKQA